VQQGSPNRCLYRIKSGTVRVEKIEILNNAKTLIATLGSGAMFGEMSILTRDGKTSASIVADSTDVEIYEAEVSFMFRLFQTEPGLRQRFFKNASQKLASKLRQLGNINPNNKEISKDEEPQKSEQLTTSHDKQYSLLFGVPADEVIIQEYPCYVKGFVKEHGRLYIFPHFICFFAKVFGSHTKIIFPVEGITKVILKSKRNLKIQKQNKKSMVLHGLLDAEATRELILSLSKGASTAISLNKVDLDYEADILSAFDWAVLLKESKYTTFNKDGLIIKEGQEALRIYQIAKGVCRVEKSITVTTKSGNTKTQKQILGTMTEGEIFGEISFFGRCQSNCFRFGK